VSDRPSRAELDAARAKAEKERDSAVVERDAARVREKAGVRTAVATVVIGGIFSLGTPLISAVTHDDPLVGNCIQQRAQAVRLVESTGTWTALPEDAELEDQCDINTYIVQWQNDHAQTDEEQQEPDPTS